MVASVPAFHCELPVQVNSNYLVNSSLDRNQTAAIKSTCAALCSYLFYATTIKVYPMLSTAQRTSFSTTVLIFFAENALTYAAAI